MVSAAGAQALSNEGQVDVVLAFTLQKLKVNLCRFFTSTTELSAIVNDGSTERRRRREGLRTWAGEVVPHVDVPTPSQSLTG